VNERGPTLDDVLYIEAIALMVEGILDRPICRYPAHIPWAWWNDAGRAICGVCHPRITEGRESE
jgi:hypothetical protein